MPKSYMPTFIKICRKLSVYVTKHEHVMLTALAKSEHVSEAEKQQLAEFFKQLKNMSVIFHKLENKF